MSYKTILVHADLSPHAPARIRLAAALANAHDAHLLGAAMTGISRFAYPGTSDLARTVIGGFSDSLYQHAEQALAQFTTLAADAGVRSHEASLVNDDPEGGLLQQARFCDLLVLGQTDPAFTPAGTVRDLAENVVLAASCPVLLAPRTDVPAGVDGPAVVAWNGSREAAHAVARALPLLRRAAGVLVAHFSADPAEQQEAQAPALLAWLSRHGIEAELVQRPAGPEAGESLLGLAAERRAGLLVMGAYGHARFRELMLGGATRSVLANATLPVLMCH